MNRHYYLPFAIGKSPMGDYQKEITSIVQMVNKAEIERSDIYDKRTRV
jgi:hypothetical protein